MRRRRESVAVAYADLCALDLPIFRTVDALIAGRMKPEDAVPHLMGKPPRSESNDPVRPFKNR